MLTGKNRFVFVAPMFNASKTLGQMLHSIAGQSYDNWKIILIDDVSSDEHKFPASETIERFKLLIRGHDFSNEKIDVIWNKDKKWEVANVLKGISRCKDDDIICRIDGDDFLCDLDALVMINAAYTESKCEALWTAHRWGFSDRSISDMLPEGADPYKHQWVTSHLKTFRKRLLNNVPYENFLNADGDLIKRCGDQAIYLPVLKRAKRYVYLPRVCYHYTIDERGGAVYQTDDAKYQKAEADFLRSRGYVATGEPWEDKFK